MPIKDVELKIKLMKDLIDRYQQAESKSPFLLLHIRELEVMLKELL